MASKLSSFDQLLKERFDQLLKERYSESSVSTLAQNWFEKDDPVYGPPTFRGVGGRAAGTRKERT